MDGFCIALLNAGLPGPAHAKVPLPCAVKLMVEVAQTVAPVADTVGKAFTITTTVAVVVASQALFEITVTVNVPLFPNVASAMVGFCSVEEILVQPKRMTYRLLC